MGSEFREGGVAAMAHRISSAERPGRGDDLLSSSVSHWFVAGDFSF